MGSFLRARELHPFAVAARQAVYCVTTFAQGLVVGHEIRGEDAARSAALLLFDVVDVGVAEDRNDSKEEEHVAIRGVVEGVGLVPLGELTDLTVGHWGFVTHLKVSIQSAKSGRSTYSGVVEGTLL